MMLSLKNNLIGEIHLGTFSDLINLKTLILSNNKLKSLDGKLFEFNTTIVYFFVDHNDLNNIGEEILNYSTKWDNVNFSEKTRQKSKLLKDCKLFVKRLQQIMKTNVLNVLMTNC